MEAAAAAFSAAASALLAAFFLYALLCLSPAATARRLRKAGFCGPSPSFPLGNLREITSSLQTKPDPATAASSSSDIHAAVFPYFARWRQSFGKVFVYWLGTEPFLYVADPDFLKSATAGTHGRFWGKPDVFRRDRMPMFGRGLVMAEGDDWARHRHIIAPAFSSTNLNDMISVMEETTSKMLGEWSDMVASGHRSIDVEKGVVQNAAEIIAKASFGITDDDATGGRVFQKLQTMQSMLFRSTRLVGVPLANLLHVRSTYEAWKLGREIDALLFEIIDARRRRIGGGVRKKDLLALLLAGNEASAGAEKKLTTREVVDECKTFFFGGHETTALALSWTLLMLAAHPEWQTALRKEVEEVAGGREGEPLDAAALARLTKMGCVINEVLRLYPPSPNVQRQALQDVVVPVEDLAGDVKAAAPVIIPQGTNMWIDVVAMHRDAALWGEDVNEFRPERFMREAVQGGCRHRLGFLPFGFGGRICVGRNLTAMELRVVLTMVLRRFSLEVAPHYRHAPRIMLSLRPSHGIHLRLTPLI
ncbi:hypothetical protein GUJ93_ZPchr0002g24845 [Zizania palustris]|uniref:Cytochrome P450 n=1 Tax=Zizania palustris TaxID=103762 RepID=A0A8J5SQQ7_ZIZPA|nr:hypothetical protein GUJ93_ZPchr0002g24845 [Zizania palustris]